MGCRTRSASFTGIFKLSLLVSAIVVGANVAVAGMLDDIKRRGYMTVATEDNYPPFEFIQDGKPAGLDHELYELLKKWAPFEVRQQILPWQGLLAGVTTGQFDVALSAGSITDQRAQQLDFTMPIAEATYYYVKRKGDERIKSVKDLSGLPFGTQQGSAMQQRLPEVEALLKKLGGTLGRPSFYVSYPDAFQDLALSRVDFVIANVVPITDLIRKRPNEFELGEPVASVTYHAWAVKKGNKDLRDFLDQFLGEQRRNGTMARLQEKWLGKSFPDLPWVPMLPGNRPMPD